MFKSTWFSNIGRFSSLDFERFSQVFEFWRWPLGFPRKINFAHVNHFWTNNLSFYCAGKKSLNFFPFNGHCYFSWASLCNLPGLASFCFRSIKLVFLEGSHRAFKVMFLHTVFAGGIFNGHFFENSRGSLYNHLFYFISERGYFSRGKTLCIRMYSSKILEIL